MYLSPAFASGSRIPYMSSPSAPAASCERCHVDLEDSRQPSHAGALYPETAPRLDFGELGYAGDPARIGGRFRTGLGRGRPPR